MASCADLDELRWGLRPYEDGSPRFNVDTYHFGKSLIPLLKLSFNDAKPDFLSLLCSSEAHIKQEEFWTEDNRYTFIQELRRNNDPRLHIFKDVLSVEDLARKQVDAERMARYRIPGWQDAMKEAGLWEKDNGCPGCPGCASRSRAKPDGSDLFRKYR